MDQCTHEVRAEYWKKIIQACGQRPAGQSAKNWMDENGICEQSYYHWQRRFRKQAYEGKYVIICTLPFKKTCRPSGRHILFLLFGS